MRWMLLLLFLAGCAPDNKRIERLERRVADLEQANDETLQRITNAIAVLFKDR